jgi:hypothetical protein
MIEEGLVNRLTNLPELKVLNRSVETIGGQPAARVEVVAPGTGDALAPSGAGRPVSPTGRTLMTTHQVTLALPRSSGPVFLSWHMPETVHDQIAPQIDTVLKSLTLSADTRPTTSSY